MLSEGILLFAFRMGVDQFTKFLLDIFDCGTVVGMDKG